MNDEAVSKWLESAQENIKIATDMYRLGHFNWSLFMWHLAIEKIIKAYLTKQNREVPYIHDLHKLSKHAQIDLSTTGITEDDLNEISGYNIEARYEDYKHDFYKKATKEYADAWIPKCQSIFEFINKTIQNA